MEKFIEKQADMLEELFDYLKDFLDNEKLQEIEEKLDILAVERRKYIAY